METLLEDYKRKLKTAEALLGKVNDDKKKETDTFKRLKIKASVYRSFIVDIERAIERMKSGKW